MEENSIPKLKKFLPHIGMRKFKTLLAVFVGFWVWQLLRLIWPGLEVHPLFIYIYGIIEIRDTSDKTVSFGTRRIRATFTGLGLGLPMLALHGVVKTAVDNANFVPVIDLVFLLAGMLLALCVAEKVKCENFCGLACAYYVIFTVKYFMDAGDHALFYALMRILQTILGVVIAWIINVKLFPYPRLKKEDPPQAV